MTLIIDGLDISSYVMQKTDIVETPVYVDGANAGTSKTGAAIFDRIHTSYTLSIPLKPLPQSVYQQILTKCEMNKMAVIYTSARLGSNRGVTAQCSMSEYEYALTTTAGDRIYAGATITVQEA